MRIMFSTNVTLYFIVLFALALKFTNNDIVKPQSVTVNHILQNGFHNKTVLRTFGISTSSLIDAIVSTSRKTSAHPAYRTKSTLLYLITILLSNSYSPEPNPGPNSQLDPEHLSWLCGTCDNLVTWENKGVVCDHCGQWFHGFCQSIDTAEYEHLNNSNTSWYCAICGNANSKTAYDLHGIDDSWNDSGEPFTISFSSPTVRDFHPGHASTPTRCSQQNKWRDRPLRILTINFQSILSKRAEIPYLLDTMKPDIIIGSETWLNSDINNAEILPNQYKIYRKDRKDGWGGVMIAIDSNLDSHLVPELGVQDCEIIWASIKLQGRRTLYVSAFYRPDKSDVIGLAGLRASLLKASSIKNSFLLIGGDFNLPGLDWKSGTLKPKCPNIDNHREFLNIINDFGLDQMVTEPTHDSNTLDLIITNSPQLVPRVEIIPGLCKHQIPYCEFNIKSKRRQPLKRSIPMFHKADWDGMKKAAIDLSNELLRRKESSTNDLWVLFKESMLSMLKQFVPHRSPTHKAHLPWITAPIRKLINTKNKMYRKMKKTGREDLKEEVHKLHRTIQRQTRRSYWEYLEGIFREDEVAGNKKFYSFVKSQKSSNIGISPLKKNGRLVSKPLEQAEILNAQFQSVFGDGVSYNSKEFERKTGMGAADHAVMGEILITEKGVKKLLENIDPHKASGPDGISSQLLKGLAEELAPGLTILFQTSMDYGVVPSDWRTANVAPIFKKGEHYDAANYRPVSLTCIVCKLLEHIIVSSIMQHLEEKYILTTNQHGFRRARSCETQLLEFVEDLMTNLEAGQQTDVLVMDFAKAFDRVNHSLLIHKLQHYGIQGLTLKWIDSFLRDRTQAVVVNGARSSTVPVKSGVPQGSVLGPCLFLVYINDLPKNLHASTRLFADDTAVYTTINNTADQERLQEDLNHLSLWEEKWDMKFHPAKCVTLQINRKKSCLAPSYHLHGHHLTTVSSAKYLGITMKSNLDWEEHINNISNKANKTLGFLRRSLKINSTSIKERAYKTYVRPLLEYAATVWDTHTQKNIAALESIQRRAARFVLNRYHYSSSVTQMLDALKWPSLESRRKNARLAMLFKIYHGFIHCPIILTKMQPAPERPRRRHNYQFKRINSRTKYRSESFLPTTIKDWNALPSSIVEAKTVDTFVYHLTTST